VVNPLGFLHGGLISLMVERQVELTLDAPMGDLVVRFVGPVKAGIAQTIPSVLTGPEGPVLRVDVVDDSGRPGAIASARPLISLQ
jgi:acyl-coenzyme A thioesterase PaaI-like protein